MASIKSFARKDILIYVYNKALARVHNYLLDGARTTTHIYEPATVVVLSFMKLIYISAKDSANLEAMR